jgi:pimeloyl-ACP methyl ester carboxylesterase
MADIKPVSMLAPFKGEKPPAPDWFTRVTAEKPERQTFQVEGAEIELLTWGKVGAPGLLLLHGGMAHADWWSFIAPYFAATHRVAALSWSGMGGSSWRQSYAVDQFVTEMFAGMDAAGFGLSKVKPLVLAHSFGGFPTLRAAHLRGKDLGGVMVLDAPVLSPEQRKKRSENRRDEKPPRATRIYASEAEALSRFRFSPDQPCPNAYIVDWIARTSLRRAKDDSGHLGWTWKFDPFLWSRLTRTEGTEDLAAATCRVAMMWGGTSVLFKPDVVSYVKHVSPPGTLFVEVPEAAHHVMADQPLALVTAVRAVIQAWT